MPRRYTGAAPAERPAARRRSAILRAVSSTRSVARDARAALAVVSALLFGLATWRSASSVEPDYLLHAGWARDLAEKGISGAPVHPLFHLLTVVVHALFPLGSYLASAVLVGTGASVVLALLLFQRILRDAGVGETARQTWAAAGWALALMLLAPITVFTWPRHQLYLGYIAPTVFHNPTIALLKPLAVAWFWSVTGSRGGGARRTLTAGLLALAATLAKPSFTVAWLPALALWLAFARRLPRAIDTGAGVASLCVGGAVLALQAWARGSQPSLLVVAPLEVMGFYSARWQMPFLLLLSLAFPLCVLVARWPAARRDGPLMCAWLVFVVAAAYGYLLVEAEPNSGDGNWLWSGQVALFVLLAQTLLFLRSPAGPVAPPQTRARRLCLVVFGLQLACGLAWYAAEVLEPHEWWFPFAESEE